jgi:hypothetical protein
MYDTWHTNRNSSWHNQLHQNGTRPGTAPAEKSKYMATFPERVVVVIIIIIIIIIYCN